MEKVYKEALSETEYILSFLEEEKRNRIPIKLRKLIKEEKSKDYVPRFNVDKPVKEQEISKETVAFLAYIYKKYLED